MVSPWFDPSRFPTRRLYPHPPYLLMLLGHSSALAEARLGAAQAMVRGLLLCTDADVTLFPTESDAVSSCLQTLLRSTDRLLFSGPLRPALARLVVRAEAPYADIPRTADGRTDRAAWCRQVAEWPDAFALVSWDRDDPTDLEAALAAGVRAERLLVHAGGGFAGQRPWQLPVQPLLTLLAIRDPDLPAAPLAWVAASWGHGDSLQFFGGDAEFSEPALGALESLLQTLVAWPAWTDRADEAVDLRGKAVAELVAGREALALWRQHGGEAVVRCPDGEAERVVEAWRASGWVCRAAVNPQLGELAVVDLFASRPKPAVPAVAKT